MSERREGDSEGVERERLNCVVRESREGVSSPLLSQKEKSKRRLHGGRIVTMEEGRHAN